MAETSPEEWANLRCWWFGSVYEIANIELQKSTWLAPPTPSPHWSYVEFCCTFPFLAQLEFALNKGYLSLQEFELLSALNEEIGRYSPPGGKEYDHPAILADSAWHAVVAKAERIRQELLALANDPIERNYLMGVE